MHVGPVAGATHKDPIHLLVFGCGRQEIWPTVMFPEYSGDAVVAVAPGKVSKYHRHISHPAVISHSKKRQTPLTNAQRVLLTYIFILYTYVRNIYVYIYVYIYIYI
jgi:hypothetical protein